MTEKASHAVCRGVFFVLFSLVVTGCKAVGPGLTEDGLPDKARSIVETYKMEKIPHEGIWFLQTHKSSDIIKGPLADRYPSDRYAYTAILTISTRAEFSAMHRLATDELWHYYGGDPSELLLLHPGGTGEIVRLGPDIAAGESVQIMVPAGTWMGARPQGGLQSYTFAGMTLSPGFEYEDYEVGYRDELSAAYPDFAEKISEFTRADSLTRPTDMPLPPAPSLFLEEKLGRVAPLRSDDLSVAFFVMPPGLDLPTSRLRGSTEAIIVTKGRGEIMVNGEAEYVSAGSVIHMPPNSSHKIAADTRMEFYAVVTPAYDPAQSEIVSEKTEDLP